MLGNSLKVLESFGKNSAMTDLSEAEDVLAFWFLPSIEQNYRQKWFSSGKTKEVDLQITQKFLTLLKKAEVEELSTWKNFPKSFLALIIVLDQFSRHIYRTIDIERKQKNDKLALQYCEEFLSKGWLACLSVEEALFLIMPLRHSPSIPRLNRALFIAKSLKTLTESRNNLIQKFCKVTQRKLYELEGRLGNPEDILEFHEFPSDDQGINETALFKVIESFFCKHHVVNYKYMMVSLSGGVDSMVLTKITCVLSKKFLYRVVCLHVDYGNRVESAAEAKFVEDWCSKLGCAFHKVDCGKYTRNETPRGEYEKISRMFRYELYVKTLFYYKNDCPGIMVGHHAGDLQENVISNLMRGCSLLDLGGMASTSVVNGVTILRPMLERSKAEILDFAHTFGVPYFKDTTPKWSNRGKLRSHLLPLLQEIYGSGVTSNLSSVARDSFELNEMTRRYIFQPFWDSVCRTPLGVHVDCAPYVDLPLYFWKEALLHLCHTVLGISMISEKPIQLMMNRLKNPVVTRLINLSMKKNYFSYLWNTTFVLFNPKFTSEVHENTAGFVIRQGQTRLLGRWTVSVSPSISGGALSGVDSEIPAILDVISGRLSYFLPFAEEFIVSPIRPPKKYRLLDEKLRRIIPFIAAKNNDSLSSRNGVIVKLFFENK